MRIEPSTSRSRLTIRWLMLLVAVVAVGLALSRLPGIALVILAGLATWGAGHLVLGALNWRACWLCSARPRYTWKVLVATSVLLIAWMSFLGIFWVYSGYNFEHLLLSVTILIPFLLGTGIWTYHDWFQPEDRWSTANRVILYLLVFLATGSVAGNWPFYVAFRISRPDLDRVADQVEAGTLNQVYSVRAGLFLVMSPRLDKETKTIVILPINDHGGSFFSFASPHFCRSKVPLEKSTGSPAYQPSDELLGDRWYYKYWSQFRD